jgi:hypothetical protein
VWYEAAAVYDAELGEDVAPVPREMHAACTHVHVIDGRAQQCIYVTGGRAYDRVCSDVWRLVPLLESEDSRSYTHTITEGRLTWRYRKQTHRIHGSMHEFETATHAHVSYFNS